VLSGAGILGRFNWVEARDFHMQQPSHTAFYARHVLALACVVLISGCASTGGGFFSDGASEEDRVATVLRTMASEIERRQAPRVLFGVSNAYKDDDGRDYAFVESFLATSFRDYRSIRITRTPPNITVQGNEARSVESLGIMAEPAPQSQAPPVNFQGNVAVFLRKVEGNWQVSKITLLR